MVQEYKAERGDESKAKAEYNNLTIPGDLVLQGLSTCRQGTNCDPGRQRRLEAWFDHKGNRACIFYCCYWD